MRVSSKHTILYVLGTFILSAGASSSTLVVDDKKKLRGDASPTSRRLKNNNNKNKKKLVTSSTCIETHITEMEYEDPTKEDVSFLTCETEEGKFYNVGGLSQKELKMMEKDVANKYAEMDIPEDSMINDLTGTIELPPGKKINFKGKEKQGNGNNNSKKKSPWEDRNRRSLVSGDRSVLVVRVIAADGQTSASEARLSDSVFGNGADGSVDPVTLKSQYSACSYGALNFNEVADRDGASINIRNGATTVTVSTSTSEGDVVMRNAITAELNSQFGVTSPNQIANHVLYCLPPGSMEGIAYAFIYSWMSVYSDNWCTYLSGLMHEVGHNLGLAHSNENGNTYNDQSGMMGYSYSQDNGPLMCFNAAKSWQLGWLQDRRVTYEFTQLGTVNYRLIGQSEYNSATGSDKTLIKLNTASATDYFIMFNRRSGINSGTVEGGDQVIINSAGGEGNNYAESELLAKLSQSGSYTISNFDGTGFDLTVTVTQINLSGTAYADITVSVEGTASPTTANPTKSPTSSPSSSPSSSPTTASPSVSPSKSPTNTPTLPPPPGTGAETAELDTEYQVPHCINSGTSCSSGNLLLGRATKGPTSAGELNSPNTIDTCDDGNTGSYRSDESLESIFVFSSDDNGIPDGGSLRVGGYATVRASVYAWSDGSNDFADFYYTNDITANPIAWTYLGSAGPGGGGDRDITSPSSFLLESSGTHAVRVRFRYEQTPPGTPNPCSNGGYDEADDLIFPVVSAGSNPNTDSPTTSPSIKPSRSPSRSPVTSEPTSAPSKSPVTDMPSRSPSKEPSRAPSKEPSQSPSKSPSSSPSKTPTRSPSKKPTPSPSLSPSRAPTKAPITDSPSSSPVMTPTTESPTASPSSSPSQSPSNRPSGSPSVKPSLSPSQSPSKEPTKSPSDKPSVSPSKSPSMSPSEPEVVTPNPTDPPVTSSPSKSPTNVPTRLPSTSPTLSPSSRPSVSPTESPTNKPTPEPTNVPTDAPSSGPSTPPSQSPSEKPTNEPTPNPTTSPTVSTPPPTLSPTPIPTTSPTPFPTTAPTPEPTNEPITPAPTVFIGCGDWYFRQNNGNTRDCSWIGSKPDKRCNRNGGYGDCIIGTKCYDDPIYIETPSCPRTRARVACPAECVGF